MLKMFFHISCVSPNAGHLISAFVALLSRVLVRSCKNKSLVHSSLQQMASNNSFVG